MSERIPVLMSACLLGFPCRYDGACRPDETAKDLLKNTRVIPVCPELSGGLPIPREPAEIIGDRVVNRAGRDVTAEYRAGAERTLRLAKRYGCRVAVLKEKSPSCGRGRVYDGSFSGTLTDGNGVTAELLLANGIAVVGETGLRDAGLFRDLTEKP